MAGLAACVADPGAAGYYGRPAPFGLAPLPSQSLVLPGPMAPSGRRVAILLPLTGANAEIGQAMLRAAQLALDAPGSPPLDSQDTGGTPDGAATAARRALDAGAGIILGPLTAGETATVAPVARAAGVPVLAFTSDAAQGQPGVWTLGITPAQQARRLVLAVQAENKTRLAAVLPQNPFGDALASGVSEAAAAAGMPEPRVVRHGAGFNGLNEGLKEVSGANARRRARDTPEPSSTPPAPPAIDALLLGASGEALSQAVPLLAGYDIGPAQVRILGTALWARDAARLGGLAGAWYAAPDPALRAPFEQRFAARFNGPPRELASLAYDAAGVARVVASPAGFAPGALTRAEGFAGADGVLSLQPDGRVRRGLAIFEIDRNGSHIVQPAPRSLSAPGV